MRFPGRAIRTTSRLAPGAIQRDKTPKPALSLSAARFAAAAPTPSVGAQTPAYAPFLIAPPNANARIERRT
jgi:hypothetical protein